MPTRDGTTALLPHCAVCGQRMSRSGRAIAALRQNPHIFDGWTHERCQRASVGIARRVRSGNRSAQPIRTQRVTFLKPIITLDESKAVPGIEVEKYSDFFIGLELEMDGISPSTAKQVVGFDGQIGKHTGTVNKARVVELPNAKIEFIDRVEVYEKKDFVVEVYPDGSVPTEVVTRPVTLKQFGEIGKIHKKLRDAGADLWAGGRAGTHMTFLLDHHRDLSNWDKIVVQNAMQLSRIFYVDIVRAFGGNTNHTATRPLGYRRILEQGVMSTCNTSHYHCLNVKWANSERIWAVEVRFPDGCNDFSFLKKQAVFWSAIFRQSAIISKYGLINFSQSHWDKVLENYRILDGGTDQRGAHGQLNPMLEKVIEKSLGHFGWYTNNNEASEVKASLTATTEVV